MCKPFPVFWLLALLLLARPLAAEELTGIIVGVSDGDALTLQTEAGEQIRIRLAEIDAPEADQSWGVRAQQALILMAYRRKARIQIRGTDRQGRVLARVWTDGQNLNQALVRAGHAWVYRRYSQDPELLAAEAEARQQGRGLWQLPEDERIEPWEWREKRLGAMARPAG